VAYLSWGSVSLMSLHMHATSVNSVDCQHFKAHGSLYIPPALTFKNSTFCLHCLFVFNMILTTISDYFPQQH